MLIRRDPVYLFLNSTETESELFTLGQETQMYYVHYISSPHEHNTPNEIKVPSRPKDSDKQWANEIVFTWNERSQHWSNSNQDNRIHSNTLMEYHIVADNPGAIVYITDTYDPHPSHDVIYLMADSIVSLEDEQKTLERAVFEDK